MYFAKRGKNWTLSEIDTAPNFAATGGFEQTLYNLQARRIKAYAAKHFPKIVKGTPTTKDVAGVPGDLVLDPKHCELRLSADGMRLAIDYAEQQAAHVRHHLLVAKAEGSGRFRVTDVFRGSEPPLR